MLSIRPVMSGGTPVRQPWRLIYAMALLPAALLIGAPMASAETLEAQCMQDLAGFGLNCTANDVQIATAQVFDIPDPCDFPGDDVTFLAQFDVVVTAKERFDIGLYFAIDGDPNGDGAISSSDPMGCSVSTIDENSSEFIDLDDFPNTGDTCGDITKKSNPLQPVIEITTKCIDTDGDGFLNLPNCTSWRQSGANELCVSPLDAFPGSPSKCRCDLDFQVEVPVPPAEITVDKIANPTTIGEPGGNVVFTVTATNDGIDPNNDVTVDSVIDDVHGDVGATCLDDMDNSLIGQTIPAADSLTCSFTAMVLGDAGFSETDTVTVSGTDDNGNMLSGMDPATVTITDVLPNIGLTKDANPTQVGEGGADVTFTVVVSNTSVEPVVITVLDDSIYGDIGASCLDAGNNSLIGQTIGVSGSLTCTFTETVGEEGVPGSETDTVTATAEDNEGNQAMAADSATVTINNLPSMITLTKTANPTSVDEPGGDVIFTFVVANTSLVDAVTLDTLNDTIYGDIGATCLDGMNNSLIGQTITAGGSVSCSFMAFVDGNGNTSETNVATVTGTDDDGESVDAMDDETVDIENVAPTAALIKTATQAVVTYKVVVTNTSVEGDPLMLQNLNDDIYGDVANAANPNVTNNSCPSLKAVAIQPGDDAMCTFDAVVTSDASGEASVIDVVQAVLTDDENATVQPLPEDDAKVILTQP